MSLHYLPGISPTEAAFVKKIEPFPYIGEGGGTVKIYGGGFSEDVFNFGKPNHGNKVFKLPSLYCTSYSLPQVRFANDYISLVCQTPIQWNFLLENPQDSSSDLITCNLPPR